MIKKVYFQLGVKALALETPPLLIDFKKSGLRSIAAGAHKVIRDGVALYVMLTQKQQVEKLFILKAIHPDMYISPDIERTGERISERELRKFKNSIFKLEEEWPYHQLGIWRRKVEKVTVDMIQIIKKRRWTIRPGILDEENDKYYGEIPVGNWFAEDIKSELEEGELIDIHDHTVTQHFHLYLTKERYVYLVKRWDYYFMESRPWPAAFDTRFLR